MGTDSDFKLFGFFSVKDFPDQENFNNAIASIFYHLHMLMSSPDN